MEELKSQKDKFDSSTRIKIISSAKLSTQSNLNLRFGTNQQVPKTSDDDSSSSTTHLIIQQHKSIEKESLVWLNLLANHFEVKMTNLIGASTVDDKIDIALHFEIVHELLLVTLGLLTESNSPPTLNYSALSRSLILETCTFLQIDTNLLHSVEKSIAQYLYFQLQLLEEKESGSKSTSTYTTTASTSESLSSTISSSKEAAKEKGKKFKWLATGAGVLVGGVTIGLTGGLALIPLLGSIGITAFSGAGGAALLGTLLGVGGGGLAGYKTHNRLKGIDSFSFTSVVDSDLPSIPSLTATIVCSGFLLDLQDTVTPWKETFENGEKGDVYALEVDTETFLAAGQSLNNFIINKIIRTGSTEIIKRSILASIYAGVALPLSIYSSASLVLDGDFVRCHDKAKKGAEILAEILFKRIQGNRPINLIGYGPGATLIFHTLLHLSTLLPSSSTSSIANVIFISLPLSPSKESWKLIRSITNGRIINTFSKNDWVLAISARIFGTFGFKPAGMGLGEIVEGVEGIEDLDVGDLVEEGHLVLRDRIGKILERVKI